MTETVETTDIKILQGELRLKLLGLYNQAHAGHIGCSLSCIDLMIATLVDKNGLQGFGQTADVLGDTADVQTWNAIGFDVATVDGHNIPELLTTIDRLTATPNGKPKMLIASTVKGKGVSYMENRLEWHYLPMTEANYEEAQANVRERYLE